MAKLAGQPDAIERFKVLADPERYKQTAQQHRDELIQQGERVMLQIELGESDPNMGAAERKAVRQQLNKTMESIMYRIDEIDAILKSFSLGAQAGMNRQMRRKLLRDKSLNNAVAAGAASTKKANRMFANEDEAEADDEEEA